MRLIPMAKARGFRRYYFGEPVGDADGIVREIEWVIEKLNK